MKKTLQIIALLLSVLLFHACSSDSPPNESASENTSAGASDFNESNGFEGTRIAVMLGSTHDQFISKSFPKSQVIRFDNAPDLALALKSEQCDLAMMDGATSMLYVANDPSLTIFKENVFQESLGFGFNDQNICNQFDAFLSDLQQTGQLQEIIDKWTNDKGDATMPDFSDVATDGTIHYATSNTNPPFSYLKNQQKVGIDCEIAFRFAAHIKKAPDFLVVPFNSLMPSLLSLKVDVIFDGITITEERAKQVIFSKSHYQSQANLVALKSSVAQTEPDGDDVSRLADDLKGKRIAVLLGSTQDVYATKHFPLSTIMRIDCITDILTALNANQCDAAMISNEQASFFMKSNPDFGYLQEVLYSDSISIGFSKNNAAMTQQFNDFLKRMKASGLYQDIYNRWIIDQSGQMPKIENSGKNGTITIGTEGQSIPYSFLNNGEIVGFDIEIIYRFAAELERTPKLFICNFSGLIPALKAGKVDVIANNIMVTEERKKEVSFSNNYCDKQTGIISRKKDNVSLKNIVNDGNDLATAQTGVMTGSLAEMYMQDHFEQCKIDCFDNIMDAITALKSKKLKYIMTAYTTAVVAAKKNPDLVILPTEYTHEGAGIAFPKDGSADLLKEVNAVIQAMKDDGTMDEMINRWINNKDSQYEVAEIPKVEQGAVLRVGCAANREPMCFIQNNKIIGLDCELMERIANKLGMQIEYVDMNFSALVTALTSKKVDVVISNFTVTKERKEKVDFSDVYFVNPQVLLAKNIENQAAVAEVDQPSWWQRVKESFYNNLVLEKRYLLIWDGLKVTCLISLLSVFFGTLLGALICFMRMSKNLLLQTTAKVYIDLLRGIPQVVLLMIMFYVVFASSNITGVTVASITFAMNFAAYVSEMFRTAINSVGKGQTEAGIAMGFSKIKTFINIVLPQAIQKVLPVYKGEFISLVKMTSIVGYIAVQDLTKASDIIRSRTFDAFFPLIMVAVLYFLLAWVLSQLLTLIEFKTAPKRKK